MRLLRLLLLPVAAGAMVLATPTLVSAHPDGEQEPVQAVLVEPLADSVVTAPIKTLSVTFNSRIDPIGGHELVVLDPTGERLETGQVFLPDNGTLRVSMPELQRRGDYTVQYTVQVQGHLSMGEHEFGYEGPVAGDGGRWPVAAGIASAVALVGTGLVLLRHRRSPVVAE